MDPAQFGKHIKMLQDLHQKQAEATKEQMESTKEQMELLREQLKASKEETTQQTSLLQQQLQSSKDEKKVLLDTLEKIKTSTNPSTPDLAKIRKDNFEKVSENFRKSVNVKVFNPLMKSAKDWLDSSVTEISMLCSNYGLLESTLIDKEWIQLIRYKLPHIVQAELKVFCEREGKTFDNVTFVRFKELLLKHCGISVPLVNVILQYFGPDRNIKSQETTMLKHVLSFKQNLHSCMNPENTLEAYGKFVDLVQRSAFCASLDDPEVQEALIEIPESTANLTKFTEVAIAKAELLSGAKSLKESLSKVQVPKQDAAASIMKVDNSYQGRGRGRGRGRGKGRGRGGYYNQNPASQDVSAQSAPKPVNSSEVKEIVCHNCGVKGHKRPQCWYKDSSGSSPNNASASKQVSTRSVGIVDSQGEFVTASVLSASTHPVSRGGDHIYMSLILNGDLQELFEFDTGASACLMPRAWIDQFSPEKRPHLQPCNMQLDLANGHRASVAGIIYVDVVTSRCRRMKPIRTCFYVIDGPHALMGRPLIKALFPGLYDSIMNLSTDLLKCHGDKRYHSAQIECSDVSVRNVAVTDSHGTDLVSQSTESDGPHSGIVSTAMPTSADDPNIYEILPPTPPKTVSEIEGRKRCELIATKYSSVFDGKQGVFKGVEARVYLKPGAERKLKVIPPSKVPVGISKQYDAKLDEFLKTGTLVEGIGLKVASQLVPVVRQRDGEIDLKLAVNYAPTINPLIEDEPYNFPTINEQIDKLHGEYFSVIDFTGAFQQCRLHPETKKILTVSTPKGFFQPDVLPYGVKTAPKIFQSNIDTLLTDIPSVACIVDDICITGKTPEEHFKNLETVLDRIEKAGLKCNPKKCKFYLPEVKYLGRIISKDGNRMDPSAVDAILNMPSPASRQELQSFLGYLSYVRRHVPDLSRVTPVLSSLLKKDVKYEWTDDHEKAFLKCKKLAGNMATLAHFDESKDLVLTTDASPVGLGACLSHKIVEGNKSYLRPIAYASRTLSIAEKNYAQVEREGLAVHWAVKYFRQFLYCRHFTLQTDCSALTRIFGPKNDLGGVALSRMNRWCVDLMEYDFTAQHIKGDKNLVCDGLSRLPQPSPRSLLIEDSGSGLPGRSTKDFVYLTATESPNSTVRCMCLSASPVSGSEVIDCHMSEGLAHLAVDRISLTACDIAKATREDPLYGRVLNAVRTGEFDASDKSLKPFMSVKNSLHTDAGCIMFGSRVVIPTRQQSPLLFHLHHTHMGIVRMKSLAREYVWWPGMNKDIESLAAHCTYCAKRKNKPVPTPLAHWPWATRPMERLHIDFAEYKGVHLLVVIDAYTKYIWTFVMGHDTTTPRTLRQLDSVFADRGLPTIIVSDNGPQFTSKLFASHMKAKTIKHVLTPPYHPASNGFAEVAVGIMKGHLHKMETSASLPLLQEAVTSILFQYRSTPHTSTGRTPFELMESNKVRTTLSLVLPSMQRRNESRQQQKITNRDSSTSSTLRVFNIGETVLVYNTLTKSNDIGKVTKKVGNNCYDVMINGRVKLISADVMSKTALKCDESISDIVSVSDSESVSDNMDSNMDSKMDSNMDFLSTESENDMNVYVIPQRRKRKTEIEKLHDSIPLSNIPVVTKTRSGHV